MSKKKNKKFKKAKKTIPYKSTIDESRSISETEERDNAESSQEETVERRTESDSYQTEEYDYVKKDIRKILFTFAIILVLLIGTYYISTKTTFFDSISDWIYKAANIQTQ